LEGRESLETVVRDDFYRKNLVYKGIDFEGDTNDLTEKELDFLNNKLLYSSVSEEFRKGCIRQLDEHNLPIYNFLKEILDGDWGEYGDTMREQNAAERIIKDWAEQYLKADSKEDFLEILGYDEFAREMNRKEEMTLY
jgi:hypothetical protein